MPFAIKMGNGGTGYLGKPSSSKRAAQRAQARRVVRDGFPVLKAFDDLDAVREYLSGETVTCLLCGRELKRLGRHLQPIHGISEDEYRKRYGIPYTYGLTSSASKSAYSNAVKARLHAKPENLVRLLDSAAAGRAAQAVKSSKPRENVQTVKDQRCERVNGKRIRDAWSRDHAYEMLNRIKSGRTPKDVSSDHDMPKITWWCEYRRKDKKYDGLVIDAIEALPFCLQAKMQRLGARFAAEVERRFHAGQSDKEISTALGVSVMTCNKITKPLRCGDQQSL